MSSLIRALAFVACGTLGYFGTAALTTASRQSQRNEIKRSSHASAEGELAPLPENQSEFIAEWKQFRADQGGSDPGTVYLAVKDVKDSFRRRAFRAALIADWVTTDPKAALAFLQKNDNGQTGQFIREWMRLDPNGAITALMAGDDKTKASLRGVLSEIARLAPTRLGEVVSALPKSESRWDSTAQDAFAIVAAKDLASARAAAESVTGPLRGQALAGVAKAWGEKDGAAAIAWAQAMPAGEQRDGMLKATLIGWAKTDPIAALDKLDLAPPGGEENYYASDVGAQVLREAGKKDWDATLRWLQENPGKLGHSSYSGLEPVISHRLNTDLAGTMRSLSASGLPGVENMLANSLLNDGYSQRDNLWTWLDQQPPSAFTRSVRGWILNAVGWKDPDQGLEYLDRVPDTEENREALQQGVRSLINGGSQIERLEPLLEKASAKIRPYLIETALQHGVAYIADGQPRMDFKPEVWLARLEELPPDRRSNAFVGIAQGWAASDPQAAVKWATALPNPEQRHQAFAGAVSTWVQTDPYEAAAWADTLPPGADRDAAAQSLANSLSQSQPETAWTWAMSIENAGTRQSAMQFAYWGLQKKDPAIADEMLRSAKLSPGEMDALRKTRSPFQ